MADSLKSYTPAFYMAGAVVIAGACIPYLLLCIKRREPEHHTLAPVEGTTPEDGSQTIHCRTFDANTIEDKAP